MFTAFVCLLSVPSRNTRRGIGTELLNGVETFVTNAAIAKKPVETDNGQTDFEKTTCEGKLEMKVRILADVISAREDLLTWYGKRGYIKKGGSIELPRKYQRFESKEFDDKIFLQNIEKVIDV